MVANIGHREELDDLPDQDVARDFYAKYEPKEVLGRYSPVNQLQENRVKLILINPLVAEECRLLSGVV